MIRGAKSVCRNDSYKSTVIQSSSAASASASNKVDAKTVNAGRYAL